jgi:hypothetical protein
MIRTQGHPITKSTHHHSMPMAVVVKTDSIDDDPFRGGQSPWQSLAADGHSHDVNENEASYMEKRENVQSCILLKSWQLAGSIRQLRRARGNKK